MMMKLVGQKKICNKVAPPLDGGGATLLDLPSKTNPSTGELPMKISHGDLIDLLVKTMIEKMSPEDFVQFFYDNQVDYFDNDATADELVKTAVYWDIIGPDESIEFTD
jgi:hypothetical protein